METEKYRKLYEECKKELEEQESKVSKYLSNVQLAAMDGSKVKSWDEDTIQKSVVLKQLGGNKVLDFCRQHAIPVVSSRSLREILQGIKMEPGI